MAEYDWDDQKDNGPTSSGRSSAERKRRWSNDYRDSHREEESRGRDKANKDAFSDLININSKQIGLIIGQRGANIKNLQNDFHVRIDINREKLTVTVKGKKSDVEDACNEIRNQMAADSKNESRSGSRSNAYDDRRYQSGKSDGSYRNSGSKYDDRRYQSDKSDGSYRNSSSKYDDRRNQSGSDENGGSAYGDRGRQSGNSGGSYRNGGSGSYRKSSSQHDENWRQSGNTASYHSTGSDYGKRNRYEFKDHDYKIQHSGESATQQPLIDWHAVYKKSEEADKLKWANCPELTKDFYREKPEVANLSADEVKRIRKENNNTMASLVFEVKDGNNGNEIPNPVWEFEQCFDDYPDMMVEIMKQGFKKPSPIQCQAWPILLKGHDMIGISQTGSGKTLAFLLPAMIHTEYQGIPRGQRGGPNVLVLAPTRELALQIESEVRKYPFRDMKAVCVYGGGDRKLQINDLEHGAEIIICTPGRLNDLIEAKIIDVKSITFLILDEADRMLDMGFEPQIRKVMLDIRPDRQTVMTSATWPPGVRRLAESYMKNPMQVCIGSLDLAATHSVKQIINIMSDDEQKYKSVTKFIERMNRDDKAIIFCGRKARADDLSSDLIIAGYNTACIHGDRDQRDREQAISDIKTGTVNILVATDIASRGLDIEDITYVINYDMPRSIEEYVHRVGRTGRAGRTGTSITYLTREDWKVARELIEILEEANQDVPDDLRNMSKRFAAMQMKRASNFGGNRRGRQNNR